MNPVPAIAAVEAAVARQPLATLQALAQAVTRDASPVLAPAAAALDTVGAQAAAATQAAQRPLEHLLQPALVTTLHASPPDAARLRQVPAEPPREDPRDDARKRREAAGDEPPAEAPPASRDDADADGGGHDRDGRHGDGREGDGREGDGDARDRGARAGEPAGPDAFALARLLRERGPAEAVSDLARSRRVLIVLLEPAATASSHAAQAWLVDGRHARRFAARWSPGAMACAAWPGAMAYAAWPGATVDAAWPGPTAGAAWPWWRLFRDGDPLLARGLSSHSGACRLRLGAAAVPRLAGPAGHGAATLAIHDRQRFAEALGGQWSVVLTVAPAGTGMP